MIRHFFFDLDNTLARSKSCVAPEHIPVFRSLAERHDAIVVSGQGSSLIHEHMTKALDGTYYVLGQNGNEARLKDGTLVWEHRLSDEQRIAINSFLKKVRVHTTANIVDESDLIQDRGCEIAYSLIGHNQPIETKEAFDPHGEIRTHILSQLSDDVQILKDAGVEVRVGGTTVLDIFPLGENKGYNVREFIQHMQWNPDECIYIGDALYPGGNDETVVGVIQTRGVKDYKDTYEYLRELLIG